MSSNKRDRSPTTLAHDMGTSHKVIAPDYKQGTTHIIYQNDHLIYTGKGDIVERLRRGLDGRSIPGPDGRPINLHHIGGIDLANGGKIAELSAHYHSHYYKPLHSFLYAHTRDGRRYESDVNRSMFRQFRETYFPHRVLELVTQGRLPSRIIDRVMATSEYHEAIKSLNRFESRPLPGCYPRSAAIPKNGETNLVEQKAIAIKEMDVMSENAATSGREEVPERPLPGGILLESPARSALHGCDFPTQTGTTITFPATTTLNPGWIDGLTGWHKLSITMASNISSADFVVLLQAAQRSILSVDVKIYPDGFAITLNGGTGSPNIARALTEADKLAGFLVFGWDYDRSTLMDPGLHGYVNPIVVHEELLDNPDYAECFTLFQDVSVQPTLHLTPLHVNPDGFVDPAPFPFKMSLRFRLMDWDGVIYTYDYEIGSPCEDVNKLIRMLVKPYLPVLEVFRAKRSDLLALAQFKRLADVGRIFSMLLWHQSFITREGYETMTFFDPFLIKPPANVVCLGKPASTVAKEIQAFVSSAKADSIAAAPIYLKLSDICIGVGEYSKAFSFAVHAMLETISSNTEGVQDDYNASLGAMTRVVVSISKLDKGQFDDELTTKDLVVFWMALSAKDKTFSVWAGVLSAPQSIAVLLALTQCFRYSYQSGGSKANPRFADLAVACSSAAELLKQLPDQSADVDTVLEGTADGFIASFQFTKAVASLQEALMTTPHSRLLHKLSFTFRLLHSQQNITDYRALTKGTQTREMLSMARSKIQEIEPFFPRLASWLKYDNALSTSRLDTDQQSRWVALAEEVRCTAYIPATADYVMQVYNEKFELKLNSSVMDDTMYEDGWR